MKPIESHTHQDTRLNIPTEELRDFVAEEEKASKTLYATRSRPFPPPASGKVAVKVINHYGDEVMKVFSIP